MSNNKVLLRLSTGATFSQMKSAIYEALLSGAMNVQMGGCHLRTDIHPFVLVVSPLASLMQDQR